MFHKLDTVSLGEEDGGGGGGVYPYSPRGIKGSMPLQVHWPIISFGEISGHELQQINTMDVSGDQRWKDFHVIHEYYQCHV